MLGNNLHGIKKDDDLQWFNPDNVEEILKYISTIVSYTSK